MIEQELWRKIAQLEEHLSRLDAHRHGRDDLIINAIKYHQFIFDYGRIQGTVKPTQVARGVFDGYSMPIYASDDEEIFACSCIDEDYDGVTDPQVYVAGWLDTANTNKKFKLQISAQVCDPSLNGVLPATSTDYPVEVTTGTWAQYATFLATVTLSVATLSIVPGEVLAIRIRRIAASGNEIAGEVVVQGAVLAYNSDKIGGDV